MNLFLRTSLLALAGICACAIALKEYVPSKECSQSESCVYTYWANQASSMSGKVSAIDVKSTVEVFCESVGNYGAKEAKKYCLHVKETTFASDDERTSLPHLSSDADKLLSGPFCFVQTEDGKIASVYHNPEEREQIVNYKKGIAAAFQANFKKTQVEVEEDTQSKHYSRYSYETIAPDHVVMHRTVDSESVIQFASESLQGKFVKVERAENVEYKAGKLLSSAGTAAVDFSGPFADADDEQGRFQSSDGSVVENNPDTYDPNAAKGRPYGTGKYSLRLQSCKKKSRSFYRRSAEMSNALIASNLHAVVERDAKEADIEELTKLRHVVPSVRKALDILKANMNDTVTSYNVKKLLVLESERGPLPGFQPAIAEVTDYLNSEKDEEMRGLLFSFIAADGSAKSQEILLHALKAASDEKERNTLTVQFAFVRNVGSGIVAEIERLIESSNQSTDPLILTYGAIGASSPEHRQRIVKFLQERVRNAEHNADLVHLIHALGNTESSLADNTLLGFLAHEDSGVRLAAVHALRYSIESKDVQSAILDRLRKDQDGRFAAGVLRALIAGVESKKLSVAAPVGDDVFEAIVQHARNDTELRAMVYYYVISLGPQAPRHFIEVIRAAPHKRGTTWNDKSDPVYDVVSPYNVRNTDVTNYPSHKAYIWGKMFGGGDLKVEVGFGAFAGFTGMQNPTKYKLFAKGIAVATAYGYKATGFEALISSENPPGGSAISNRFYVSIVGKVLVDYSKEIPICKTWSYPLTKSPEYTLLSFTYKLFIYVGTLDFSLSLTLKLGVVASLTTCVDKCATATAAVTPSVTITGTAGASITLVELARGGIDLSAAFQYEIVPQIKGSFKLPGGPLEFCLSLSHGWPSNTLSIYVYYQIRVLQWCKGWLGISYPCGFPWSDKRKWDAASFEWALPTSPSTVLWTSCGSSKMQCD